MSNSPTTGHRPGTVVTYAPDPSRFDPRWCREGVALADDRGHLVDTYWSGGQDSHLVTQAEAESVEVLFHVDDYDEIERYGRGDAPPPRWSTYAPADRQRITSQHGLQARYFVRKGAAPDYETQVENARAALANAQWDLDVAQRHVESCQETLDQLIDTKDSDR